MHPPYSLRQQAHSLSTTQISIVFSICRSKFIYVTPTQALRNCEVECLLRCINCGKYSLQYMQQRVELWKNTREPMK